MNCTGVPEGHHSGEVETALRRRSTRFPGGSHVPGCGEEGSTLRGICGRIGLRRATTTMTEEMMALRGLLKKKRRRGSAARDDRLCGGASNGAGGAGAGRGRARRALSRRGPLRGRSRSSLLLVGCGKEQDRIVKSLELVALTGFGDERRCAFANGSGHQDLTRCRNALRT